MKRILTDGEIKNILETEDWYNFPQDAIRAAEKLILEKIGAAKCYLKQSSSDRNPPHGWSVHLMDGDIPLYAIPFIEGEE